LKESDRSHQILHTPTSPLDRRPAHPHSQPSGSLDTHFSTHLQHPIPENPQKAFSHGGEKLIFFDKI
jgi:hypothetical protein